jgi:hypothetical protein
MHHGSCELWRTVGQKAHSQYLLVRTMEMSPCGKTVNAGIQSCSFLMSDKLYLLFLHANYCITCFRVWQNSNIEIHFKQSFYYYVNILKKKVQVYLHRKNTLCIGDENLSFNIADLKALHAKVVTRRWCAHLICTRVNTELFYPSTLILYKLPFNQVPHLQFSISITIISIRIQTTFRKSHV